MDESVDRMGKRGGLSSYLVDILALLASPFFLFLSYLLACLDIPAGLGFN